jgi:iron complex outermembrane recepter protein
MRDKTKKREKRRKKLAGAFILGAMGAVAAEPTLAQELRQVSADERVQFDIAAQPLSSALSEFARQARVNALYFSDDLRGLSSPPLRGSLTRQQALDLLLARSGHYGRISGGNLVLVQENPSRPQRDSAASGAESAQASNGADDAGEGEEEIVVTGTRIRGANPAGANVITLDAEDLRETGRSTLQDALAPLPQNFLGGQNELTQLQSNTGGNNTTFGSSVNLRGLGADATLTLVNGRRLAPGGVGNFVDISTIPLAAVQRVEILADGASATYGSDAVAGVVNVILDRDFEGGAARVRYGGVTDGDLRETTASYVFGGALGDLSIVGGYEYRDRGSLALAERDQTADSDLRRFGGDNFSRNTSNPGNITRVGASNVVIAIPRGQDGSNLSQSDLLVGQVNLQNTNRDGDLYPTQTSHHGFFSAQYELTPSLEFFIDGFGAVRDASARDPQLNATFSVPASNAWRVLNNLFPGQGALTMAYNFGADLGPLRYETRAESQLLIGGVEWRLPGDWQLEATASLANQLEDQHFLNAFNSAALTTALASSNLETAFNPFADGSNTDPAALASLTFRQDARADSEMQVYSFKADGPLFALPAGPLRAALGVERREESFELRVTRTNAAGVVTNQPGQAPADRATDAIFAELFVPIVSEDMRIPLVHDLDLSLSIRREHSDDYGTAETPKIGLRWRLAEDFTVRATWGESFKAPQFVQTIGEVTANMGAAPPTIDPNADDGSTGLLQLAGPNPDLRPERGRTWTAGFDYQPNLIEGLSLHGTYFDIDFADRIARAGSIQVVFRNPSAYGGYLILDPTQAQIDTYLAFADRVTGTFPPGGIEAIYDGRLTNLASLRLRGVDLEADYRFQTPVGEVGLFASASGLFEYSNQPIPALDAIQALDTFNNPVDWKGRLGASWRTEDWAALAAFNYVDDYRDNISTPNRRIESWGVFDVSLTRRWGGATGGADITLTVQNLTDEPAPFVNNTIGVGFDAANASLLGRFVAVEVRHRW